MLMIERGDRHLGYLDLAVIMRKWVYHLHDDLMVSTKILSLSLLCRNIVQWNEPYTVIQDYECIHMCRVFYILTIIFNSLNGMYWIWLYIEKYKVFYCYSIIFSIFRCSLICMHYLITYSKRLTFLFLQVSALEL